MLLGVRNLSGQEVLRVCDSCCKVDVIKYYHKKGTNISLCRGCRQKASMQEVVSVLESKSLKFVSGCYTNNRSVLTMQCVCGNEFKQTMHAVARGCCTCTDCQKYARKLRYSGNSNPMAGRKGALNPAYKDGISDERRKKRRYDKAIARWALEVKRLNSFTCDTCKKPSTGDMESHHLYNYMDNIEKAVDVTNGVCLCSNCHKLFHKRYGKVKNTPEQYREFKEVQNGN